MTDGTTKSPAKKPKTFANAPVAKPIEEVVEIDDNADDTKHITIAADNEVIDKTVTFEQLGLNEAIIETCKKLGYEHPTKIQRDSIPIAIQGRDIIGIAETGSGKTASFLLPVLHNLLEMKTKPSPCSVLILAPTRELAVQIFQHAKAIGSEIGVTSTLLVGGESVFQQQKEITDKKKAAHIVVGTPGRVCEHLRNTKGFNLYRTKHLILDEADKMLGAEFEKEIALIFGALPKKSDRNTYLYSATMTKSVDKLQKAQLNDPVKIQVSSTKYTTVQQLKQEYLFLPEKYKEIFLTYLLNENPGKRVLVFVAQNVTCLTLALMLRQLKFPAVPLSGQMADGDRMHCLRKFISGDRPILIATDIASRGLDIPLVELVINYDIPVHSKEYVHRVGRTARIGNEGRAVTMVTQYDVQYFQRIEQLIERKMDECKTDKDNVMVLSGTVSTALENAKKKLYETEKDSEPTTAEEKETEEEVLSSAIRLLGQKRKADKAKKTGGSDGIKKKKKKKVPKKK
jgi:ATP-dependent RNA helicase DDX47/RRP3